MQYMVIYVFFLFVCVIKCGNKTCIINFFTYPFNMGLCCSNEITGVVVWPVEVA